MIWRVLWVGVCERERVWVLHGFFGGVKWDGLEGRRRGCGGIFLGAGTGFGGRVVEVFGGWLVLIRMVYSGNTKVESEIWLWGKKNERRRKDGGRRFSIGAYGWRRWGMVVGRR